VTQSGALAAVVAAAVGCGRIGFSTVDAKTSDVSADAATDAPAFVPIDLVVDDFERTVASGWGSAPVGGVWTVYNPDGAQLTVAGGAARIRSLAVGTYTDVYADPMARDVELRGLFAFETIPTSNELHMRLSARVVANSFGYSARAYISPGGSVRVGLFRIIAGNQVPLADMPAFFTVAAGELLGASIRVVGAAPTELCGKFWRVADGEPATCTFAISDASPELEGTGRCFVVAHFLGDPVPSDFTLEELRYQQVGPQ
jgi:hypothetical protein